MTNAKLDSLIASTQGTIEMYNDMLVQAAQELVQRTKAVTDAVAAEQGVFDPFLLSSAGKVEALVIKRQGLYEKLFALVLVRDSE